MKKSRIIALAAVFSLTLTATTMLVSGDDLAYDSQNDPLISLSYVNEVLIPNIEEKIAEAAKKFEDTDEMFKMLHSALTKAEGELSTLQTKNTALEEKNAELLTKISEIEAMLTEISEGTSSSASSQYVVVHVKKGAKLLAKSPCELILRSGHAIVVSITANGINDFSNGTELMNAADVPLYHGLLIPRGDDGRGIEITSEEAYVMVRGEYEIVE